VPASFSWYLCRGLRRTEIAEMYETGQNGQCDQASQYSPERGDKLTEILYG
jgi:hypothetical protein